MWRPDVFEKSIICELYTEVEQAVDSLPYTETFDELYEKFCVGAERKVTKHEFWRALANLRKQKKLVRKGR